VKAPPGNPSVRSDTATPLCTDVSLLGFRAVPRYHSLVQLPASKTAEAAEKAFARGDDGALEMVYRHYGNLVYTFCRKTVEDTRAEDVTQEVFISAWKSRNQFDPAKGSLAGWLISITKNRIIDNMRSENRHAKRRADVETAEVATSAEVERVAERLMIAEALRRLPIDTRKVIVMHYFEGLPHGQIAATMSLPLGTVKSNIYRGLTKIREFLEPANE